jgi:flavodoxin
MTQLNALIVFESMFGNTAAVAEAVAEGLRSAGVTTDLRRVTDAPACDDAAPDLLVVGAPTHALSLSRSSTRADAVAKGAPEGVAETGLREWLGAAGRSSGTGRCAVAFDTRIAKVRRLPLSAAGAATRQLRRKGFADVLHPEGFVVADIMGELLDGELARARDWGVRLAREVELKRSGPTTQPSSPVDPSGR